MMRTMDLRGKTMSRAQLLAAMPRADMGTREASAQVQPILDRCVSMGPAPCATWRRSSIMCVLMI